MKISTLSLIVMAIVATSSVGRTSADATKRRCRHRPTSTATVTSTVSPSPTHFKFAAAAEETTSTVPHSSPHPSSSVPASSTIIQPRPIHTSNTPQGSSAGLSADQQGALAAHNNARAAVGVGAMTWSSHLEATAQSDAARLVNSNNCALEHNHAGQNLYWSSVSSGVPLADAVSSWMNEGYTPNTSNYNHASQCLWSGSTQVGCAAVSGACGTVICCNYNPVGNIVGQPAY